jgi:hypothetical protein
MGANAIVEVRAQRNPRPEQRRAHIQVLLVEQFAVLDALDLDISEGSEVIGKLGSPADEGQLICRLTGGVTFDIEARDPSMVDERLCILDILRDALRSRVVLIEEKDDPGSGDDAQFGQGTFNFNRPQAVDAATGQSILAHLMPSSTMIRLWNAKFRLGLERVSPSTVLRTAFLYPDLIGAFLHRLAEDLALSG